MNILVLTPWFPDHLNDQQGNFVLDSIEALCSAGHRVHVLVTRPYVPCLRPDQKQRGCSAMRPEMSRRGFTLECVQYLSIPRNHLRFISNRLYVMGCAREAKRLIAAYDIDVIHAHTELAGSLGCRLADETGTPIVTTLHGINLGKRYLDGMGQREFMRRALTCPGRLVLVGSPLLDFARLYADALGHVKVVPNGFREAGAASFRHRRVLESRDRIRIVSVSNLIHGKGIDINLAALSRPEIVQSPRWHYDIVGDGPQRTELEEQARGLGILDRVSFHGQCDHDKVYALLSDCDVFSLPSAPEAFGVAYLEAMACGLLAIGIAGQGPSSFIDNGRTGLLVREKDVEGLAAQLLDILNKPQQYAAKAAAGRDHVWKNFTWDNHARSMTQVFSEAIDSRRAAAK